MPTKLTTLYTFVLFLFLISCQQRQHPTKMQLPDATLGQTSIDSFYDRVRFAYEISEITANRTIEPPLEKMATRLSMENTDLYRHLTHLAITKEWPVNFDMSEKLANAVVRLNSCPPNRLTGTYLDLMRQQEQWVKSFLGNLPKESALTDEVKVYLEAQNLISEEDELLLSSND